MVPLTSKSSPGLQDARRRTGSILIMVVVVLVLLVVIGAAYIQSRRWDRIATHLVVTKNIDAVAAATIAEIQSTLHKDIVDSAGNFLDEATNTEPYDYPSTNASATFAVTLSDNTKPNASGGQDDDIWLASTSPDFTTAPTNPRWPHVTNLNGIFLKLPPIRAPNADAIPNPANAGEVVVNETDYLHSDATASTNVLSITGNGNANDMDFTGDPNWQAWGADADGDGIPDSRWTWAPIRQIGGVTYVMAVRIVDNSAMANANVWLSQISGAGAYDTSPAGTDAPHWNYPTELDLGGFAASLGATLTGPSDSLEALLSYRLGAPAALPTTFVDRTNFWLNGARIYAKYTAPYQSLSIQDELRMRLSNGLSDKKPAGQLETNMPTFLRTSGTAETTYTDFAGTPAGAAKMQAFMDNEPRHQITTRSGAAIFAPRIPGDTTPRVLKVDLNKTTGGTAITGANTAGVAAISNAILNVISTGTFTLPTWAASKGDFADQFTACILDYKDRDNLFTKVNTPASGTDHWGMEQVPIITEVYVQGRYTATDALDAGGNHPPGAGPWVSVTWTLQGVAGFAIEIRNPFKVQISLQNIHLYVDGTEVGTSLDSVSGQTTLDAGKAIVLYQNSNGDTGSGGDDDVGFLITAPNATKHAILTTLMNWPNKPLAAPPPAPTPVKTQTISVELRGTDGATSSTMTFPYDKVDADALPSTYTQTGLSPGLATDPTAAPAYQGFMIRGHIGNSNGLNMLAISGTGATTSFLPTKQDIDATAAAPNPLRDTTKNDLNADDKTTPPAANMGPANLGNLANEQLIFKQSSEANDDMTSVGELAQIAIIGPDSSKTVPEKWAALATPTDVSSVMLDFTNATGLVSPTGNQALPQAALILDRFTTLSPAVDGVDNDNDGTPDNPTPNEEQFVPGTINLNTVTEKFLERVLPIADPTVRQTVAQDIIAYRDITTPRPAGSRTTPGIASIGELMNFLNTIFPSGTAYTYGNGDLATYNPSAPTQPAPGTYTVIDFSPNAPDGVKDDRKKQATVMRWLSQTCTVRSDIYTAYVLIEGFPSGDFRLGPVEATRFYVVFDRSGITDSSKPVKILGIYKVN